MSNTYFQMKQFLVHQNQTAMKVSTDACLFGAVVAEQILSKNVHHILDIGSGTGLLSLMLAQVSPNTNIDAVEMDADAYQQSVQNFKESIFAPQLTAYHTSIQEFRNDNIAKYDLIICNPPFFSKHLKSVQQQRSLARHNDSLTAIDWVNAVDRLLTAEGSFWMLLPTNELERYLEAFLQSWVYPIEIVAIKDTPQKQVIRYIVHLTRGKQAEVICREIAIKNTDGAYQSQFIKLLQPYYLHL